MKSNINDPMDDDLFEKKESTTDKMLQDSMIQLDSEDYLLSSEKRFRALIENSADAIVLVDSTGIVKYQSPAYAKMMGRNESQRLGKESLEFVHPNDHTTYREVLDEILNSPGLPVKFTVRCRHNNGSWHRLECVANNLLEESDIQGIVVNIHDTTDRLCAEEALRESEERYRIFINSTEDMAFLKDENFKYMIVNRSNASYFNKRESEIIGKSDFELMPEEGAKECRVSDLIAINSDQLYLHEEQVGDRIYETRKFRVQFQENIFGVGGFIRDITKQKQVEEMLKKNSDRLMRLNDCLSSLGSDYDININRLTALCGVLLSASCALYNRLENGYLLVVGKWQVPEGFKEKDLPDGHLCYDVIQHNKEDVVSISNLPETCYAKTDPNVLAYGLYTYCGQVVRSEGKPVGSLCVMYSFDYKLSDEDRRILGIIGSAIGNEDSRKCRSEALKASESKLKELNATKDKFFSIIAHDLKGPFNGIIGFSTLLKEEARNLDISTIIDYAEMINYSALQTHRLLENLLSWARIQQGVIMFSPVPNLLYYTVNEVIDVFQDMAARKKIALINQVPVQLIVNADLEMLKTILRNLISNAIKFTNANGKVSIEAVTEDSGVEIDVADNGRGIKAENMEKLFNVGISFSTRGTENEKGTGLGLILCKEFVEKHGGSISAESTPGKGSKFKFTLPL